MNIFVVNSRELKKLFSNYFFLLVKVRHILGFCWKALKEFGFKGG
jgi:hypothetical protein